ncbi:MAG: hypothetical protein FWD90_10985 [Defluviitaleaceae bacterium]|nr:hypothetical protein [Defluviitaleaceae bacterium]
MKKFLMLVRWEYSGMFGWLCAIAGGMAALQFILINLRIYDGGVVVPLSQAIRESRASVVFFIAFAVLMGLIAARLFMGFATSKSIYVLLALPGKRKHIYQSKLAAAGVAAGVLVAAQMAVVKAAEIRMGLTGDSLRRGADFYLTLLDIPFLRMIYPATGLTVFAALTVLFGSVCVVLYAATAVKAKRYKGSIIATVLWMGTLLLSFPLHENLRSINTFRLTVMLVIAVAVTKMGMALFESGEVAG